jgi:hypothetical protein
MANNAAKQRSKRNEAAITNLRILLLVANVCVEQQYVESERLDRCDAIVLQCVPSRHCYQWLID